MVLTERDKLRHSMRNEGVFDALEKYERLGLERDMIFYDLYRKLDPMAKLTIDLARMIDEILNKKARWRQRITFESVQELSEDGFEITRRVNNGIQYFPIYYMRDIEYNGKPMLKMGGDSIAYIREGDWIQKLNDLYEKACAEGE